MDGEGTLIAGLVMCTAGVGGLLGTVTPAPATGTTSLALADHPDVAGTASSFLGIARFAFGGFAAPLVGLDGTSGIPLGVITVASTALAGAGYALTSRSRAASRRVPAPVNADRSASAAQARVAAGQDAH